ncbi:MAG: PAS domain S-box protein, partial [Planctomycetota bacterium]|nr:PAS domain S-box protein [Planctomycetota bacterium]
ILWSAAVGLALNRTGTLGELLQQCAQSLVQNLDLALVRIWTVNEADNVLELQAAAGHNTRIDGPLSRVPIGSFLIGRIAHQRAPFLTNDVASDPDLADSDWLKGEGLVAFVGHPLIVKDRLVGALAMFSRHPFTPATFDATAAVASQIAAGIERKQVDERLQFTQFTIDKIATAVFWSDKDSRFFNVNEAACRMTGYTREELLSFHIADLDVYVTRENWSRTWKELQDRRVLSKESRLRCKNGTEIPVSINCNLLQEAGREYACTLVQDIIERKAAEFAQDQGELRFRAIFNQTFEFVGLLSNDGTLLEVNQSGLDLRGLALADVAGLPFWETPWLDFSALTRDQARHAVVRAASGGTERQEMTIRDLQGVPRKFDFSFKPVHNEAGRIALLIVDARDVTEQKRLEEQFRQAQKMEAVGKLAGGVAHDFNNLLTIILGYSDMVRESLPAGDPLLSLIAEIHNAGERAERLTRQLLAFSRKQVLVPVVLDLNSLLADMEKMLGSLIGEDVELVFRPAKDLWRVRVDAGQMEQVIMNLLVNARAAMLQGGKLTLKTANIELDSTYVAEHPEAKVGEHVLLSVSDTGSGMDRATLAQIFEPFFTTKGPENGTGLGLAMVYGIVKQSDGHIQVDSELGRGTTFHIYLPRDREGVSPHRVQAESQTGPHGSETVLLVEDEAAVRALARAILQRNGYQVMEAASGSQALLICEQCKDQIHLLATDVVMPLMSGRELVEKVMPLRPDMKVLYMSGYMDDAIVRHGLLDTSVPFLQKPYTPNSLAKKVREVLDH